MWEKGERKGKERRAGNATGVQHTVLVQPQRDALKIKTGHRSHMPKAIPACHVVWRAGSRTPGEGNRAASVFFWGVPLTGLKQTLSNFPEDRKEPLPPKAECSN